MNDFNHFPEPLRRAVNDFLQGHSGATLLTTCIRNSTPYVDKSIKVTTYRAYVEWGNLMSLFSYDEESYGRPNLIGVTENHMNVGDIQEFLKLSHWFQNEKDSRANESL